MLSHALFRRASGAIGALAVILAVTGVIQRRQQPLSLSAFDQPFYLGIAHDLRSTGRFTNGFMFDTAGPDGARPAGMRFSPLYPVLIAGAASADPALRAGMDCVVATHDRPDACPAAAPSMRAVQFAMLATFFLLVWWIGGQVCGAVAGGWIALGVALIATPQLMRSVELLMTETTCLLLSTAAIAAWLQAVASRRPLVWSAASGALLGLTALTRPGFVYLLAFGVLLAAWSGIRRSLKTLWWRPAAAMAVGGVVVLAPWVLRNRLVLGRAALTYGYDSHTLVQRIAFDTMTWREYGLAYLCWLPDGTSLGRRWIGPGACDRFGWDDHPNSFYSLGLRHMLDETLRAAGGYEHHLQYLLRTYILPHPLWHMAVSVPLALRGAYVAHWWGFVLLPVCLSATVVGLRRGEARLPAVTLPGLFMLAFNASVAVNQARYNFLLVPAYAAAFAWLCTRAAGLRGAGRGWHGGSDTASGAVRARWQAWQLWNRA